MLISYGYIFVLGMAFVVGSSAMKLAKRFFGKRTWLDRGYFRSLTRKVIVLLTGSALKPLDSCHSSSLLGGHYEPEST